MCIARFHGEAEKSWFFFIYLFIFVVVVVEKKKKENSLSWLRVNTEDEFPTVWVHTLNAYKEISRQQSCDMHKKIFGEIKTTFNLNLLHRRLEDSSHKLLPCFLKKQKKKKKDVICYFFKLGILRVYLYGNYSKISYSSFSSIRKQFRPWSDCFSGSTLFAIRTSILWKEHMHTKKKKKWQNSMEKKCLKF